MWKVLLVAGLLLLPGGAARAQTNIWVPGTVLTNPSTNDILVTTGTLARANYRVAVYVYSPGGVGVMLQRRNSAGTVLTSIVIPATVGYIMWSSPTPVLAQDGDTFKVLAFAGATTTVQATILLSTP